MGEKLIAATGIVIIVGIFFLGVYSVAQLAEKEEKCTNYCLKNNWTTSIYKSDINTCFCQNNQRTEIGYKEK